mmetsp:Transcript_33677/g.112430  ORF Transcript_33677/g.112430 Transcript_33677/m.112430 type:complete len:216 (+) Transcript_33677:289-936(+)
MVATPSPLPVRRVQRILGGGTCFGLMVAATTYTYALVMPELRTSLHGGAVALVERVANPSGLVAFATLCLVLGLDEGRVMQVARRPLPSWSACEVCHIRRPPGSHHCRTCDVCTRDFDHHCGALGTCIASGNRKIFILLLAASAVANLVIGGVSGLAAWQWLARRAPAGTFPLASALSWQFVATFFPGLVRGGRNRRRDPFGGDVIDAPPPNGAR